MTRSSEGARSAKRGPLGGWESIETRDGCQSIRLETERGHGLVVIVDGANGELVRVTLPFPRRGFGGHELVLSKEERYLALFVYSGQSENGYELFELRPSLRHLGGLPYVRGEGHGPAFSDDERWLALASATNPSLNLEECDLDDDNLTDSDCVIEWAKLRVEELPRGPKSLCSIRVRVPKGVPHEGNDNFYPEGLGFSSTNEVCFTTSWGEEVRVALPLPESVTIAGPLHAGVVRT